MGRYAAPSWAHAVGACGEGRSGGEPLTLQVWSHEWLIPDLSVANLTSWKPGWLSPECSNAKLTPCPALLRLLFPRPPSCCFPGLFCARTLSEQRGDPSSPISFGPFRTHPSLCRTLGVNDPVGHCKCACGKRKREQWKGSRSGTR